MAVRSAVRAGQLRHPVEIQEDRGTQRTTSGVPVPDWRTVDTVYMAIEPVRGREYANANRQIADVTHMIWMRYNPDVTVTPANRLKFGARIFDVEAVLNEEERNYLLRIEAKEEVG
jgi:SPP1 family predicted phage head-tail adaptor